MILSSCFWEVEIIACVVCLLLLIPIYHRFTSRHVVLDPEGRAVLITGCDSGFGNMLAHRLLKMGFTVFATCLYPEGEGAQSLINGYPSDRVKVVRLDVSSDKEMDNVKQYVLNNLPEKGLWGVVNNAGISTWGLSEWMSIDQYKKLVDVNLLGTIRTTLAFTPLVRKSQGRMVFLSSISAIMSLGNGIYSLTKAGIEKFCDSLRLEMKRFGVKVSIIQPGNYARATNIQPQRTAEEVWNSIPAHAKDVYDMGFVKKMTDFINREVLKGSDKGYEIIDAIVDALTSDKPKIRYLEASLQEKIAVFLYFYLPTSFVDAILAKSIK
ncbi:D-beta-hydroxybutyrate dehydrogenase, mitochondrial-like [Pelobates cultripes]|uniref:D-beta-hydroxybutyrate dehydrogenase, mitochondrial-like n=1 Tax=Pelobates cultripes TaxID=61616 RepID=A0AAD1RI27_PELCU|nr:D-beta-hydroxybutyrate dehydrogenase, mitochondrial-like [Pelobates cultripes]